MKKILIFILCFVCFSPFVQANSVFIYSEKAIFFVKEFIEDFQKKEGEIDPFVNVKIENIGGIIPQNATNVPFLELEFFANSSEDLEIRRIEIGHQGLGLLDDIETVKVFDGIYRFGTTPNFSKEYNSAVIYFISDPVIIPAGKSKKISIVADINAVSGGGEHIFVINNIVIIGSKSGDAYKLRYEFDY